MGNGFLLTFAAEVLLVEHAGGRSADVLGGAPELVLED